MRVIQERSIRAMFVLLVLWALPCGTYAQAAETFSIQARLFLANTSVSPEEVNQAMSAEGLKSFEKTQQFGAEITYPALRFLDLGMRYTRRSTTQDEVSSDAATAYQGLLSQDSILLLARVPFVRTSLFKLDVFGGVGGSNSSFELKSASQDGAYSKKATDEWVASPLVSFGASIGFGYKSFYVYAEGGYEKNTVAGLARSGTVSGNVNSLELSGRYFMVGLMFDGISGYKK